MKFKSFITIVVFFAASLLSVSGHAVTTDEGIERNYPGSSGAVSTRSTVGTPLTTLFAANNAFAGNTFDVEVLSSTPVVINGFDVNLDNVGSTNTISLYTRQGSSVGVENNPGDWTLAGTDSNVISAGIDSPSHVDISNIVLQPGQTYGFYIDLTSYPSSSFQYTNGGPTVYSDANLQITTNTGQSSPAFSGSFTYREVNTTLYYSPQALPAVNVPTLSFSMIIFASLLLAVVGFIAVRRKSNA